MICANKRDWDMLYEGIAALFAGVLMTTTITPPDFARYGVESHWFRPEPMSRSLLIIP